MLAKINLRWHDLRDEALSRLADDGVPGHELQMLAGERERHDDAADKWRSTFALRATVDILRQKVSSLGLPSEARRRRAKDGGEGQNRTVDTTIFSRMLYQLSYLAAD